MAGDRFDLFVIGGGSGGVRVGIHPTAAGEFVTTRQPIGTAARS